MASRSCNLSWLSFPLSVPSSSIHILSSARLMGGRCALKSNEGNPLCLKGHSRAGHRARSGCWGNEENGCDSCGDQATPPLAGQTKADNRQKRGSGRRRSAVPTPLSSCFHFLQPLVAWKGSGLQTPDSGRLGWSAG